MKVYNKLIRDKIPAILTKGGKNFTIRIASKEEYSQKLKEKLLEEVNEYLEEPSLEELADITEVLGALLYVSSHSLEELEATMRDKKRDKGAFKERIILESVHN